MKNVKAEVRLVTREAMTRPPRPKVSKRLSPVPVFPPRTRGFPFASRKTSFNRRAVPPFSATTPRSTPRATRETSGERRRRAVGGSASSAEAEILGAPVLRPEEPLRGELPRRGALLHHIVPARGGIPHQGAHRPDLE